MSLGPGQIKWREGPQQVAGSGGLAPGAASQPEAGEEAGCLRGLSDAGTAPTRGAGSLTGQGTLRRNSSWEKSQAGRPGRAAAPPVGGAVDTAWWRSLNWKRGAPPQPRPPRELPPGLHRGGAGHPRALSAPNPPALLRIRRVCPQKIMSALTKRHRNVSDMESVFYSSSTLLCYKHLGWRRDGGQRITVREYN